MTEPTQDDILDWAETIADLLYLVPRDCRSTVLAEVAKLREKREKDYGRPISGAELMAMEFRNWHGKMLFKSHVIHAFTRNITNNHSAEDADKILFMQHPGPGSGRLLDYIGDLPSLNRKKRKAA